MRLSVLLMMSLAVSSFGADNTSTPLDAIVDANAAAHGIPAQAVVVLRNGKLVFQRSTGALSVGSKAATGPDTVFPIFSVSKLFADVLLFQEVERGHVDLDAPASRYLPTLPAAWSTIPVRQFLDHASGVAEYYDPNDFSKPFPPTLADAIARAAERPAQFKPNTSERYTQTNFLVLEAMLEKLTGKSYRELVRARILEPLGLKNVWLNVADVPKDRLVTDYKGVEGKAVVDPRIPWPAYAISHVGVQATAADLATFLDAVASGKFVSPALLVKLWHPHVRANGETGTWASGWDWGTNGAWHEVGHDGGAKLRARILFKQDLTDHLVIVYLTNGTSDNVWSRKLVESVQAEVTKDR